MKKILALILIAGMAQGLVSQEQPSEYKSIMRLKYVSGMIFTLVMVGLLIFL